MYCPKPDGSAKHHRLVIYNIMQVVFYLKLFHGPFPILGNPGREDNPTPTWVFCPTSENNDICLNHEQNKQVYMYNKIKCSLSFLQHTRTHIHTTLYNQNKCSCQFEHLNSEKIIRQGKIYYYTLSCYSLVLKWNVLGVK